MANTNGPKVGIGVLIFNTHEQLLLGKRLNSHGENQWGPPGGHLEWGESFEHCAIRETLEETGLIINNPKFLGITNDIFLEQNKHYVSIFLFAKLLRNQEVQNCEPNKTLAWEWFDLIDLPNNLFLPLQNFFRQQGNFTVSPLLQNTFATSD